MIRFKYFPLHHIVKDKDGTLMCSCSKGKKCESPGKHPVWAPDIQHGIKDASSDQKTIEKWAIRFPECNWAIATGNGLVVIDIDPRNGGDKTWDKLKNQLGAKLNLNESGNITVFTGGGGYHIYFLTDGNAEKFLPKIGPGIDIKGEGGYVVAPPSNHISGKKYLWAGYKNRTPEILYLPDCLRDLCVKKTSIILDGNNYLNSETYPNYMRSFDTDLFNGAGEGHRHLAMYYWAAKLFNKFSPEEAWVLLLQANSKNSPPLDEKEVKGIFDWWKVNHRPFNK